MFTNRRTRSPLDSASVSAHLNDTIMRYSNAPRDYRKARLHRAQRPRAVSPHHVGPDLALAARISSRIPPSVSPNLSPNHSPNHSRQNRSWVVLPAVPPRGRHPRTGWMPSSLIPAFRNFASRRSRLREATSAISACTVCCSAYSWHYPPLARCSRSPRMSSIWPSAALRSSAISCASRCGSGRLAESSKLSSRSQKTSRLTLSRARISS